MLEQTFLSDIRLLNLTLLLEMQAAAKRDPVSACFRFGVRPERMLELLNLSNDVLQSIVAEQGQQCLFAPIDELWKLIGTIQKPEA